MREKILSFLENGERPDLDASRIQQEKTKTTVWPLPVLQLLVQDRPSRGSHFPDIGTLIDIAIKEKRHNDVLKWYRLSKKSGGLWRDHTGEKVAQVIQETHPDEAISIWKALVTQEIAQAKPSAYQTAGHYLKKMNVVYARIDHEAVWSQYMAELREQNKRRPRMLDVLNALEGRRTRIVE